MAYVYGYVWKHVMGHNWNITKPMLAEEGWIRSNYGIIKASIYRYVGKHVNILHAIIGPEPEQCLQQRAGLGPIVARHSTDDKKSHI